MLEAVEVVAGGQCESLEVSEFLGPPGELAFGFPVQRAGLVEGTFNGC